MSGLFGKDLALEWLRSQWMAKEMKRHVFVCRPQTSMVTHKIFQVDESKLGPDVLIFTDFMFSLELWRRCPTPPLRCCSVPLKIKRISKSLTRRWWKKAFSSLYNVPNSIAFCLIPHCIVQEQQKNKKHLWQPECPSLTATFEDFVRSSLTQNHLVGPLSYISWGSLELLILLMSMRRMRCQKN